MIDHIGISFSESALFLSTAKDGNIQSVERIEYPYPFGYDGLLSEKAIDFLSEQIQQRQGEDKQVSLSVVLPLNYTHFKRVALPMESEKDLAQIQVEWEFKNYLSGDLSEYKIINTQTEFRFAGYREWLFLAIKKTVLQTISSVAEKNGLLLRQVVPVNHVLEKNMPQSENPILVFKIDSKHIESYMFINGMFYDSYLDAINADNNIVESCKKRFLDAQVTLERFPALNGEMLNCRVYGDGLNAEIEKQITQDFTCPVTKLHSAFLSNSETGLEAVEVLVGK